MNRGMILLIGWLVWSQVNATQYKTYEENGKVGMKDDRDQVIIPPSFEALGWSDGSFSVISEVTGYRLKGRWGIINLKKEFVTKAEYESLVYAGGENIVAQKKNNQVFQKKGSLNLKGEQKIPFIYDGIIIQGLRAIVFNISKNGFQYGLVDLSDNSILPIRYKYIFALGSLRYAVENNEGKIGLFSDDGKPIIDFVIDSISQFYKGYAIVYQNHLQGLVDREGVTRLESKYQSIKISEQGKVFAQLPSEWKFINTRNETLNQIFTDELRPDGEKGFYIRKGKLWGVINDKLLSVIPSRYQKIKEIGDGRYMAEENSKKGVINAANEIVIPFQFDSLIAEHNEFFRCYTTYRGWQLLDANGKILTDHFYNQLDPFGENWLVKSKGFYGILNPRGKEFVHCVFDSIANQASGLIAVKFKNKYGIINEKEDWHVTFQNFPIQVINEKVYLEKQPGNQFVKLMDGSIKYFTPYPLVFLRDYFTETLPNGVIKRISYDGLIMDRTKTPEQTEEVFHESEGFIGIKKDGRYGFVDKTGSLRIANRYDSIVEFQEGLAPVKLIGKWGLVNNNGQIVINPNYDQPIRFDVGLAIVSRNKKFGLINKEGKTILPLRYDAIIRMPNSFIVISAKLKGMADLSGSVTIEPRFDYLQAVSNELLIAGRDGKFGVISNQGLNIIAMEYDELTFSSLRNVFLAEKKSELKEIQMN